MPARQVFFVADNYYHIYNRGSEKRIIFQDQRDYRKFLDRSKENAEKYAINILCFCLMPNHFHFLLKQTTDMLITRFMNSLQLSYAKYFNTKYTRVGPLFQGRFKAKLIDSESYLLQLSAYIHRNPVHIVQQKLQDYPYSSYKEYLRPRRNTLSKPSMIKSFFSKEHPHLSYQSFVETFSPNYEEIAAILLDE